jgi:uncharacterized protein (TIGR03437 family)
VTGEIIHLYLTGLGPVAGVVQTGVPASANGPLQPVLNLYTCNLTFATTPPGAGFATAPVLFAGLAPGLVGLYQLDLRVPSLPTDALLNTSTLGCNPPLSANAASAAIASFPVASQSAKP